MKAFRCYSHALSAFTVALAPKDQDSLTTANGIHNGAMADFIVPKAAAEVRPTSASGAGPIHTARHVKVICIGAGASGLLMAYKLQRHFENFTLVVYEKNPAVAGTWFENRYPGCACDVPAHNYTWSFEPKIDWSATYASSREIEKYFNDFASKYGLYKYIKCRHQVVHARWNERTASYTVAVKNDENGQEITDTCDILINAGGILNNWRWPAIPGIDKYKGTLLHTANWDDSVSLDGKHVGLIGNGSSGIQVLPAIQPHVKKVTTFIREPTYVSPVRGMEQHVFTESEKGAFESQPGVLLKYRRGVENGLNDQFDIFLKDTDINKQTQKYMQQQMQAKINNTDLANKLIPRWTVGCRRLTPGVGYLESLTKPNVKVVYGEVSKITARGCLCDDGVEYPVDVLICATGFDTGFRPRLPVIGKKGTNLQDQWSKEPQSYLGMAAANMPNYLMFLGPNCPIGNGPVLSAIETQANYICKLIDKWQTHNVHSFVPHEAAVADFVAFKDRFMERTVWNDPCRSWYKANSAEGKVTALWPGSTLHYIEALDEVRWEDWDVIYEGNRFDWLGNGHSQAEQDPTADLGYYIRDKDDDAPLSRLGRMKILSKSGTFTGGGPRGSFSRLPKDAKLELRPVLLPHRFQRQYPA